jgi:hypothetical protein
MAAMATSEQSRTRAAVVLGGAALALVLLLVGRRGGAGGGGGSDGGPGSADTGAAPLPAVPLTPKEVQVWLRSGDRIELDGVASDLTTTIARARAVGRAHVRATGDARMGWIGTVINAMRVANVTVWADASLLHDAANVQARAEGVGLGPTEAPRNAAARRRSALSKTKTAAATLERQTAGQPADPPYAWQRGLDMEESRRIAASLNEAARNDEARRSAALLRANPPAELRARVSVEGTRIIVDTEANTGVANEAWLALRAANVHIWDTQGPRIIIVGRDSGNNLRVEQVRAKTIDVLRAAGFVVDVDSSSSMQEMRNAAASRRGSLPRYDERKGLWCGGDSRTLYAFTSLQTGRTWVAPGATEMYWGPEATVRVATRDEAEELWQRPLHPGWMVAASPRNAAIEPTHIAVLRRMGGELFATRPLFYGENTVINTSPSVQGAIASAPPKGDLQVLGEYTSDGTHWGIGRGRLVARRENGRWLLG